MTWFQVQLLTLRCDFFTRIHGKDWRNFENSFQTFHFRCFCGEQTQLDTQIILIIWYLSTLQHHFLAFWFENTIFLAYRTGTTTFLALPPHESISSTHNVSTACRTVYSNQACRERCGGGMEELCMSPSSFNVLKETCEKKKKFFKFWNFFNRWPFLLVKSKLHPCLATIHA